FNRIKLVYTSKLIDYPVSYQTRHTLAILHNNEGICEMVSIVRQACMAPLSPQNLFNIAKIEEGRDKQWIRNLNQITKRNSERALELQSLRVDLNFFDWDQELVSYGRKAQEQINSNIFHPSFASHITDFDETTKCLACHSFPKCTARGDPMPEVCMVCDNCVRRMADNPSFVNVKSNMQKMLEVIDAISKVKQQFGHLPVYQEKFPRILKTKEDAFLLLDDLVLLEINLNSLDESSDGCDNIIDNPDDIINIDNTSSSLGKRVRKDEEHDGTKKIIIDFSNHPLLETYSKLLFNLQNHHVEEDSQRARHLSIMLEWSVVNYELFNEAGWIETKLLSPDQMREVLDKLARETTLSSLSFRDVDFHPELVEYAIGRGEIQIL
ncbi:7662_t:CDS:2, partial [Entrophospora sp. SA101]